LIVIQWIKCDGDNLVRLAGWLGGGRGVWPVAWVWRMKNVTVVMTSRSNGLSVGWLMRIYVKFAFNLG